MMNAIRLNGIEPYDERESAKCVEYLCTSNEAVESCPECGVVGHFYRHGVQRVGYKHTPGFGKQTQLWVDVQRYRCRSCGKTFNQSVPEVDASHKVTKKCAEWIVEQGIPETFSAVARAVGVDEKTVRNICIPEFQRRLSKREMGDKLATPTILGIDELMLDGEMRAIFMDVGRHCIVDLIESRSKAAVARWMQTQLKNLNMITVVSIDMWPAYRDVACELLPNAMVVVDKFHVQRCANKALDSVRNRARREASTAAGRKNPWRGQRLLRKSAHRLNAFQQLEVDGITANNPLVADAYQAKEAFFAIWGASCRSDAEARFDEWKAAIPKTVRKEFGKVARMIDSWRNEVFAYFDCGVTNAITENRNGLVKMMNRLGRGYTFDVIRAKALLAPSFNTRICDGCHKEAAASSFGTVTLTNPELTDTWEEELCNSCRYIFNKYWVPLKAFAAANGVPVYTDDSE